MTLEQLMILENIDNYNIWWYGANFPEEYFTEDGLVYDSESVYRGADLENGRIYIVVHGIDAYKSRYKFALKLVEHLEENKYRWEKYPISLDQYRDRLIFKCNRRFTFYNSKSCSKDFNVEAILPSDTDRNVEPFRDYDSVELTFLQLREVIDNQYNDYYEHLSCVKAIYMIIDGNTGKQYIGSAYEETDSLWTRWKTYANTCHGNNIILKELYDKQGEEYFYKFKYLILHILPKKTSMKEIIEVESRYKQRFMTREFGLNAN